MIRIWQPETTFDVYLMFAEENAIDITHHFPSSEFEEFAKSLYTRKFKLNRSSPAVTLVLTLDDFNVDFFEWGGSAFVSERMRQAMALDPVVVRFFEVDDSKSAPLVRSKNYQMMEPEVAEKVLDLKGTQHQMRPILPEMPFVPFVTGRLALRPDASPKHDLFYDSFFTKELFCTDTFALRVLRAGCTGLRFMDPDSRGDRNLFRTMRGIEESIGEDSNGVEITRVVEAID